MHARVGMVSSGPFQCRVPLHLLSSFFKLDCLYPQKRVLAFDLQLASNQKTLIVGPKANKKVKLIVKKIQLSLQYAEVETSIKSKWFESIDQSYLTRVFPTYFCSHRTITKGSTQEFLPTLLPFGLLPNRVSILFMKESTHVGNYENTYCYKNNDVSSLKLYKDGIPHYLNQEFSGKIVKENTNLHFLWYNEYLKCYGSKAASVDTSRFYHDLFVFTFYLSAVPVTWETDKNEDTPKLNLYTAGTIDLEVTFANPVSNNLVVCAIGYRNAVATFNADGEIVVPE